MNSEIFYALFSEGVRMNTLWQTQESGSYISDDAHSGIFSLLQLSSIVRNGMGEFGS